MNKKTEKMLVPKLRFPEFQNSDEWEENVLSGNNGIAIFVRDRIPLKQLKLENYISTENILPDYSGITISSKLPPAGSFTQFKKGDILVSNIRPYLKKVWFSNMNGASSNDVIVIRSKQKIINIFLSFLLKNDAFINYIMKGAKGVKMPRGDITLIEEYSIIFPSISEQKKIADCFSSIEDLTITETKKLDDLKTHKKGLMQQLFPAEGETVPKLRFADFRNAEEWKEIRFIDVTDKKKKWGFIGGPFGSNLKSSDYVSNGIRIIQLQNIGDAEFINDYKIFTSEEKANELLSCNIYPGDIILSKMGDPVGRACLIPDKHARYVMCSDGIRVVIDEDLFNKYFIYSLINSVLFRKLVENTATGSTRKRIGLDELKNLPMVVPKQKEEQKKIADCLSSIDDLITAQTKKIELLKTHKKGLMHQLFPALDKVSE